MEGASIRVTHDVHIHELLISSNSLLAYPDSTEGMTVCNGLVCFCTPQWSFHMMNNSVFGGGSALTGKFASVTRMEPKKEGDGGMMCEVHVCTCAFMCVLISKELG